MTDLDDTILMDAVDLADQGTPTTPNLGQKTDDPAAPYGRKRDGTPRGKPGPRPSASGNTIPKSPRIPTGPTKTKTRPASAKTTVDYRQGIQGLLQIPAGVLSMAGQFNETFALDGAAIAMHAPGIAEALNQLADDQPAVAAALDRVLSAGPYGAILGAVIPLAMQLAANHKLLPDAAVQAGGALPRDAFRDALISQHTGNAA